MSNSTSDASADALRSYFSKIQRVDESVFLSLQVIGGQVLLPLLVITTIFSRKAPRSPVFINFCISWIISSIIYSLLVYRGRSDPQDLSLDPSSQECLVQASLINGAQALTSCATFALVIQLFLILKTIIGDSRKEVDVVRSRHTSTYLLLCIPFLAFLIFSIVSVVLGSSLAESSQGFVIPDSNLALPGAFYCLILFNTGSSSSTSSGYQLVRAPFIFSSIVSLMSLCLEVAVATTIFRQRSFLRRHIKQTSDDPISLLLRVVAFSIYRMVALGLNLAVIVSPVEIFLTGVSKKNLFNGVIDFVQAAIPLVAFLIFALKRDILSAWQSPKSWTLRPWKEELTDPRSNVKRKNSDDSNFAVLQGMSFPTGSNL